MIRDGSRLLYAVGIGIVVLIAAAFGMMALTRSFVVEGPSMWPTLLDGDRVLASRHAYSRRMPERGEIAVFYHPSNDRRILIKRVVGLPGDEILITGGVVYINRCFVAPASQQAVDLPATRLESGELFVMGDNRTESADSTVSGFGAVHMEQLIGPVRAVYWPPRRIRFVQKGVTPGVP